jgi:hypothetical protein
MEDPVALDSCFHAFCRFCILQWIEFEPARRHGKNRCPLCRSQFKALTFDFDVETKQFDIVYVDDSLANVHWSQFKNAQSAIEQQKVQRKSEGVVRRRRALVYSQHLLPIVGFRIPLIPTDISAGHRRVLEKVIASFEGRASSFLSRELPILLAHDLMAYGLDSYTTQQNETSLLTDLILGSAPGAMAELIRFTYAWTLCTTSTGAIVPEKLNIKPLGAAEIVISGVAAVIGAEMATILIRELMIFVLSQWSLAQFDTLLTYVDPNSTEALDEAAPS